MRIKRLIVGNFNTNCYLLITSKEMVVVDPGAEPEVILSEIIKSGVKPEYIINTHYHPDHTGANERIRKETGAKILIHEAEKEFISFKPDKFLKGGEKIKIGNETLEVIHTPGHSAGSVCILGKDFILTGDTIFKEGFGRTDIIGGSWKALDISLRRLKKVMKAGVRVFPGHGDPYRIRYYK